MSAARWVAFWLALAAIIALGLTAIVLGGPAADDIGSWRWVTAQPA
jgi:hypothetical protein